MSAKKFKFILALDHKLFLIILFSQFCSFNIFAADSLSYSGRLVNNDGSPVPGPVTIRADLAYTNGATAPDPILCTKDISNVILTKGVFHIKLAFDCSTAGIPLNQVLAETPVGESAVIRITDVRVAPEVSKVYSFQAIHSVPFSNLAEQLVQMGATDNQVLKWSNANKKWGPGGGGTVTSVSGTLPITVASGTTTPAISISQANTSTNGYLSSTDWNTFNGKQGSIAAGTTAQYYRGDKTWQTLDTSVVPENVANLYYSNARVLLAPLTGFTAGTGAIVATDTTLQAFGKAQGQIDALTTGSSNYLVKNGSDTLSGTVSLTNVITATATGDIVVNSTPLTMTSAVNKAYVDTQRDSRVAKTGDTMSGALTLDNNLNLNPNGTAAGNTGEARFKELAANGANYVALKSPDALAANVIYTLPAADGVSGQALTTNAAGGLSWTSFATTGTTLVGDVGGTIDNNTIGAGKVTLTHMSATGTKNNTTYLRGDNTWAVLQTDVQALLLSAYAVGTNAVLATTDSVVGAFGKLQKQISDLTTSAVGGDLTGNLPNPTIAKLQGGPLTITTPAVKNVLRYNGTTWVNSMLAAGDLSATGTVDATTYLGGDNTWKNLNTNVIAAPLTGLSATASKATSTLGATDSITVAFNKLLFTQGDYVSKSVDQTINGTLAINSLTGFITVPTPINLNDAANKGYVDGFGQWTKGASSSINYTAGNVGIGTTSPGNKLVVTAYTNNPIIDVLGQADLGTTIRASKPFGSANNWASLQLGITAGGTDASNGILELKYVRTADGTGDLLLYTPSGGTSTEKMRVTSSGNVGIGTATPTNIISLDGNAARTMWMERHTTANTAGNNLTLQSGGATSAATDKSGGSLLLSSGTATGTGSSLIQFLTATPQGSTNNTDNAPTAKMTILGSGNVGVGTNSPSQKLEVAGKVKLTDAFSATNAAIVYKNNTDYLFLGTESGSSNDGAGLTLAGSTNGETAAGTGGVTIIVPGVSPALVIKGTTGNVGIGTSAPSQKLEVSGNAKVTGSLFGASRDPAGNALKMCVGKSTSSWVYYSLNSAITGSCGAYIDVDTSSCSFTTIFKYFSSISGNGGQWTTSGASAIYAQTATGFRVYVNTIGGGYDATTCSASTLPHITNAWYIDWMAAGM